MTERQTDVLIDVLYAVAIGINVYLIVDTLSDGQLSRSISMKARTLVGNVHYKVKHEETVRKEAGKVIWEAIDIVEGIDNDND